MKKLGDRADEKRTLTEPVGDDLESNTAWKETKKHMYWLGEMTLGLEFSFLHMAFQQNILFHGL